MQIVDRVKGVFALVYRTSVRVFVFRLLEFPLPTDAGFFAGFGRWEIRGFSSYIGARALPDFTQSKAV